MYYRVVPFSRSFDTYGLVYEVPEILQKDIKAGMIVQIPFKTGVDIAMTIEEVILENQDILPQDIKMIEKIMNQNIFLESVQRELLCFISQYYITPIHNALQLFFPKNLLERISKNTLGKYKAGKYVYSQADFQLSDIQASIFEKIRKSTQKKHLIYGVTGSGKTQIYMKLIQKNLDAGKQTLLLIPEIILTSQIGERVKEVFGQDVIILHSGVSQAKKTQYWMDIQNNTAKIIIGTRSALFYPYNTLGSVIIDEEHDGSYISDSAPRYHAGEVAEKLCELGDIELILGSGTPKVETFYRALQGKFELHQLLEKYT